MLYSQLKDRENRFIVAIKIGFPFTLLSFILFYTFKVSQNSLMDVILSLFLIPLYVYYIFYLIYDGFRSTLLDPVTKTFTRKEMIKKIQKLKQTKNIVLLQVQNIADINERYGNKIADHVIFHFCLQLDIFLKSYNFKDIPIGRYGGGNFLLILPLKSKQLSHLLHIFLHDVKNKGINEIEIKVDFSMIESNYDAVAETIIKKLFFDIYEKKEQDNFQNIKPDEFEKVIIDAIENEKFIFKYQPLEDKNKKIKILEVLPTIYSKSHGMLRITQIEHIINQCGYENIFYKKMFFSLIKELKKYDLQEIRFSIKISPVTLRNNVFIIFINQLFHQNLLNTNLFILNFHEKKRYDDIHRFKEILLQYKKFGFTLSLENFAGDNTCFEYIKHLPIDMIKFDIEFTKNFTDEKYKILLENYLKLLQQLKIQSTIKFIDKESTYKIASSYEPDFIGGFFIYKPKSLKQILHVIKEKNAIR
ncbi:MAG: GGDEF domain-containing protein [Sulfurospirillum sp.]|nr:GGDEF domain-containing protein [Sulfurospirillum sp.]